jgi:hypothetical protein
MFSPSLDIMYVRVQEPSASNISAEQSSGGWVIKIKEKIMPFEKTFILRDCRMRILGLVFGLYEFI